MKQVFVAGILIIAKLFAVGNSLECYSCISSSDIDCARRPGKQLDVRECKEIDECVTAIDVNGSTIRGCLSDVFPNSYCSNLCEKCNQSLCNVRVYPADRLRCYECFGSSCIDVQNNSAYEPLVCGVYKKDDRCYTNVISQEIARRGCEAADWEKLANCTNICLKCNYNGCNDEKGVTRQNCLSCLFFPFSPSPDYACLRNQMQSDQKCEVSGNQTCYNKVLLGHRGKCYTFRNEQTNVLTRGCSSSIGSTINGKLWECDGENCNADCVNINCNVCDTKINPACRNATNLLTPEKCESHSCYSCEAGLHLWRGCGSKVPQPAKNQVCYECRDSDGCNKQSIRSCYKCSSINDPNCATWSDIAHISISNCTHRNEKCVTTLVSKLNLVYTLRGCDSQVSECTESDPFCDRCEGSLCNYGRKTAKTDTRTVKHPSRLRFFFSKNNGSEYLKLNFLLCFTLTFSLNVIL